MPDPCIKRANRRWHLNTPHEFQLIGANFDQHATVALDDGRADWDAVPAAGIMVSGDGKVLHFQSQPNNIHGGHGLGNLTITVTNPGGSTDTIDVDGTYA